MDDRRRGFSLQNLEKYPETRLDMRMNSEVGLSASEWLQAAKVEEIAWVLREYGPDDQDSYRAERLAQAIFDDQQLHGAYDSMSRFAELVGRELMVGEEAFEHTATGRAHPARLTLQAIRLFLNSEIEQLREGLKSAFRALRMGGRCVVTTFKRKEAAVINGFLAEMEDPDPKKACESWLRGLEVLGRWSGFARNVAWWSSTPWQGQNCKIVEPIGPGRS